MKFIIYIILSLLLTLISCKSKSYDYLIYDLKKEEVSFYDAPLEIRDIFNNYSSNHSKKVDMEEGLIYLGKDDSYKIESVKTKIGSWIAYVKLIDKNKNISYRMDYNTPIPYIIFDKKLYLADQYNPFSLEDFSSLKFTCYFLK